MADAGVVLPLVLVVVVVLGLVVVGLATYTSTTLRYGQTTEERTDRFASAQGAMDNSLERLEIGKLKLCSTGLGFVIDPFPVTLNAAPATVECRSIGGSASDVDGWAAVITGVGNPGGPNDDDFVVQSGGGADKFIGGPVWLENRNSIDIRANTTIEQGDLFYPEGCNPQQFTGLNLDSRLFFTPGNGTVCTDGTWNAPFRPPATSVPSSVSVSDGVPALARTDSNGCTVFEPGRYNLAPLLGANNYFKSGNYYFHNVGTIVVKQTKLLFGNMPGVTGFPSLANVPCSFVRGSDNLSGATVYMGGNSRFDIEADGALEFSRRSQIGAQKTDRVSVHVIDPGLGNQPSWSDPVIETKPGNNKQLAIQGLLWAPNAALVFGEVTNDTTAAIRGGVVVARLDAGASASSTGFLIEVPTSETERLLQLTSTAQKNGATTQVRAVLDLRSSTGETALRSWRVCEGAC
jgi:hypothetical protein